ncbi:hypothetical protein [Staphylococcus simiae]|uniref:Uncharacterized protein n=1 Tax=Staphylococcus simiae CCM 7213 = CCUG 51256 TaxID=911238 RepID=G5JHA3_9STAP|nr:hypothetical protein [Staphylococcus simiae]EHJ08451.1 hypothetical protein SS7213T_04160 [Staphylococcus simiae CCM 7213 = CCUG 51256]PNZ12554.1 hypothetical protein CD113_06580 [Staphylococcus simiae]SNV67529.1 Uncharacterised protein [Staphylococcus simiae]
MATENQNEVSYYLPRHEFYEKRSELLKYIDDGDKKVEDQLDQVNIHLLTFIESQKPLHETMQGLLKETKLMNTNLTSQVHRTDKLEDEQSKLRQSIENIQEENKEKVSARNKLIIGCVTAFCGGGGLIPVLAQIFFR